QPQRLQDAARATHAIRQEQQNVFADAGDFADVSVLDVEEQRAGDRVFGGGNGGACRFDAVQGDGLDQVSVLGQEGVADDTDGGLVLGDFLHDQVVVFAGGHVGAVAADSGVGAVVNGHVLRGARHDQFFECVARA